MILGYRIQSALVASGIRKVNTIPIIVKTLIFKYIIYYEIDLFKVNNNLLNRYV